MKLTQRYVLFPLLTFGLLAGFTPRAQAVTFTFTSIDVPGATGGTFALGMNNAGQIAGAYSTSTTANNPFLILHPGHGYLRELGGGFTTFDFPGANDTLAWAINAAGQIVGNYFDDPFGGIHGFLRDPAGTFTSIDVPGAHLTAPTGINDSGQIVGDYSSDEGIHGFLRDPSGSFTTIDFPGAVLTQIKGINNAGQIVGHYVSSAYFHGFLRDPGGSFTTFDFPGAATTGVGGINDLGQIVGTYAYPPLLPGVPHGYLWDILGVFTPMDFPGASETGAFGINNSGQIVGIYFDGTQNHGYLAVPDPASLLSDLIALVETFNLRRGIENSLDAKLQNAEAALTAAGEGSLGVACNLLDAFINEVEAQSGHALTVDQANQLITMANQVKAALNCP